MKLEDFILTITVKKGVVDIDLSIDSIGSPDSIVTKPSKRVDLMKCLRLINLAISNKLKEDIVATKKDKEKEKSIDTLRRS